MIYEIEITDSDLPFDCAGSREIEAESMEDAFKIVEKELLELGFKKHLDFSLDCVNEDEKDEEEVHTTKIFLEE